MCGICGIYYFDRSCSIDRDLLLSMNSLIFHRGPDEEGFYIKDNIGLAMRRLKVIDLETGSQPMFNEDRSIVTVYNGEIYNFHALRKELESLGHSFATNSDTEVIVHAYEEWDCDFPRAFNGMFSIALFDIRKKRLILVRDRFGIKPLYYLERDDRIVFGSELKPVIRSGSSSLEVDDLGLSFFLSLEYIPAPHTLIRDIKKLNPGTMLVAEGGRTQERRYYSLFDNIGKVGIDYNNLDEQIYEQLSGAVKKRLIADVPIGSFLSGGIDSSIIVYLMRANNADPLRTFSIGFDESSYNELKYSNRVSKLVNSEHIAFKIKPHILGIIDKLIYFLDEPIGDFSIFPTYMISKMTRDFVTVALSGDGGDELFGGYEQYRAQIIARYFDWIPGFLMNQLFRIEERIPPTSKKKGIINNMKRLIYGMRFDNSLMHYRWMLFFDEKELREIFADQQTFDHFQTIISYIRKIFKDSESRGMDDINRMCMADLSLYMQENILLKVDRMSMANSLEVRVPFLDHNVVELAFSIRGDRKIRMLRTKHCLRNAFRGRLPKEIIGRKKEGFSIPLKNWIKGDLRDMVESTILSDNSLVFFNQPSLRNMLDQHYANRYNHSHRIWSIFVFLKWYDCFIKNRLK